MADEHDKTQDLNRREALKTIATGIGAAVATIPLLRSEAEAELLQKAVAPARATTRLRFFSPAQHKTVEVLSELIIPTDERSPGGKAAKCNDFIDLLVSESPKDVKDLWTAGLTEIDSLSTQRFGKPFAQAAEAQQVELLTEIGKNETEPKTPTDRFFRELKTRVVQGYYTSEIGIHKELQYKGNTFLTEFVGCTHPEHQA